MDVVEGYIIREHILYSDGHGIALGENPIAPQPFVTWQFSETDGKHGYYWGHYSSDGIAARADFAERAAEYAQDRDVQTVTDSRRSIRFIDSRYNDLFTIKDGGDIYLKRADDERMVFPCVFVDEYHTKIGNKVYHICEFAEKMEELGYRYTPQPPGMALDLPEQCYSTLPSSGELVLILRGESTQHRVSYSSDDPEHNHKLADQNNARLGVTKAAEQAMLFGSIHKWDAPAANPYNYTHDGKPKLPQQGKRNKSEPGRDR